jgi:hypothetical protein
VATSGRFLRPVGSQIRRLDEKFPTRENREFAPVEQGRPRLFQRRRPTERYRPTTAHVGRKIRARLRSPRAFVAMTFGMWLVLPLFNCSHIVRRAHGPRKSHHGRDGLKGVCKPGRRAPKRDRLPLSAIEARSIGIDARKRERGCANGIKIHTIGIDVGEGRHA